MGINQIGLISDNDKAKYEYSFNKVNIKNMFSR